MRINQPYQKPEPPKAPIFTPLFSGLILMILTGLSVGLIAWMVHTEKSFSAVLFVGAGCTFVLCMLTELLLIDLQPGDLRRPHEEDWG